MLIAATEAGIAPRLAALSVDAGIAMAAFALLNLVLYKLGVLPSVALSQHSPLLEVWQQREAWIVLSVLFAILVIVAWSKAMGTPGALLLGINVVRARDGGCAGLGRCAWRLGVSLALVGFGLLGAWRGKRALLDRLSGTRVVREDEATRSLAHYAVHAQ